MPGLLRVIICTMKACFALCFCFISFVGALPRLRKGVSSSNDENEADTNTFPARKRYWFHVMDDSADAVQSDEDLFRFLVVASSLSMSVDAVPTPSPTVSDKVLTSSPTTPTPDSEPPTTKDTPTLKPSNNPLTPQPTSLDLISTPTSPPSSTPPASEPTPTPGVVPSTDAPTSAQSAAPTPAKLPPSTASPSNTEAPTFPLPLQNITWDQSANITGMNTRFGESISLSSNGTVAALAVDFSSVAVYKQDNETSDWLQFGPTISVPNSAGAPIMPQVQLTPDAAFFVVRGAETVRVYNLEGENTWLQFGPNLPLNGTAESASISDSGLSVAIGFPARDSSGGLVRAFRFSGTDWIQQGTDAQLQDASEPNPFLGHDVKLSSNGNRLVACASRESYAYVQAYEWNGSQWVPEGRIDGLPGDSYDRIYISSNGQKLGVLVVRSSPGGPASPSRLALIYRYNGTSWVETNEEATLESTCMALSSSGYSVGLGDSKASSLGTGNVKVLDYVETDWKQRGPSIVGPENAFLGRSCAISGDAKSIAASGSNPPFVGIWKAVPV